MPFLGTVATAQNRAISGTVVDANGEALIGASVVVKGNTSVGTVTDFDGNFAFSVPSESSTIVVSYVGMNTSPDRHRYREGRQHRQHL